MKPRCFIIAEAGVNHNGSVAMAKELIDVAADIGADAIKFQSFSAKKLVIYSAPKAKYQQVNTGNEGAQYEMLKALELSRKDTMDLREYCDIKGIEFLSTPFDPEILTFLVSEIGMRRLKIPSGEILNGPLLLSAARTELPIIISTGMCTLSDVEDSLSVLAWGMNNPLGRPSGKLELARIQENVDWKEILKERVWIMHCVTQYPAKPESCNLLSMDYLKDHTGLPVGLSDHSAGQHIALAAIARGARVLEKHLTLSRSLEGPDHKASIEPDEFGQLISDARDIEAAIGEYGKQPQNDELENMEIARGSIVASRTIRAGEHFTFDNLAIKRPGSGMSPMELWDVLSRGRATREYAENDMIVSDGVIYEEGEGDCN